MATCDVCFHETNNRKRNDRGELLCGPCRLADERYRSMTPDERAAELHMITRHVAESEGI